MKDLVRDPLTGEPLLCCWDECGQYGDNRHQRVVRESNVKSVTYIFCGERHKLYWVNSHLDNGNLPAGMKNVL